MTLIENFITETGHYGDNTYKNGKMQTGTMTALFFTRVNDLCVPVAEGSYPGFEIVGLPLGQGRQAGLGQSQHIHTALGVTAHHADGRAIDNKGEKRQYNIWSCNPLEN